MKWLWQEEAPPYNSCGNGSAMRVSAVGWAFDDMDTVMREAARSAEVTHNHPEGIKGAQAVAAVVFLARTGHGKEQIRKLLSERFKYDCSAPLDALRRKSKFEITCQATVPAAAVAFLESTDFEDAILVGWRCRYLGLHCGCHGRAILSGCTRLNPG